MTDSPLPFIEYSPPAGGLQRLQRTLAQDAATRPRWAQLLGGGAALTLAVWVLCLAPRWWAQQQREQRLTAALQQAVAPQKKGIEVTNGAAIALPSGQANVQLYLVQSLP